MKIQPCLALSALCGLWMAAPVMAAPPANDSCSGAIVINSVEYSNAQSTTQATSTGDPSPSCVSDFGNGVWYLFTTSASGQLEVDTANSDFDTGLAIYTGTCGALTEVACNDDDLLNGVDTSRIEMQADAGVTYRFLAGGSSEATGNLNFHLTFLQNGPPVISTQPANQSVSVGSNATFQVQASSLTALSYFWKENGGFISGANGSSFTFSNAQLSDSGTQFSCLVSNSSGTVLSSNATLFVSQPTLLYKFDFESGLEGFTINNAYSNSSSYAQGLWHWSTGRAEDPGHSPTHSLYYGKNETATGGGNYDTGSQANAGVAISPPLNLSGGPITLSFSYLMNVEPVYSYPADLAYVDVSTNQGASYVAVEGKGAGLSNNTAGLWVTNVADLSAFASTNVWIRFRFDTVDSLFNDTEGWYVDDIRITGLPSPQPEFSNIFDTNGQIVFTWNPQPRQDYQLQFKTNLSQAQWLNLGAPITNGAASVSNSIGPDPQRFYRLEVVP